MKCVQISQSIRMYAKLFRPEQKPVPHRLSDRTVLFPSAGTDVQRPAQERQSTVIPQRSHQTDVFHQTDIGEASQSLKHGSTQKDPLIAIRNARTADQR